MSKPMTPAQTIAQLNRWHVPFKPVDGWKTRNRKGHGAFDDVHGFVVHHTGDDAPDTADLRVIRDGRADLPGPLAQFGCDDSGIVWLVGNGRANHAGGGDPAVLRAVMRESYTKRPPATHKHQGSAGAVDGNAHFYGVETFYSGKRAPTARAYESLVLLAAAICDFHGWSAKSVIGHKERSDWKSDPGSVDMADLRADVQHALDNGPNKTQLAHPAVEQTRVRQARQQLAGAIDLLDEAIASGRGAAVESVRDELVKQHKRLPTQ